MESARGSGGGSVESPSCQHPLAARVGAGGWRLGPWLGPWLGPGLGGESEVESEGGKFSRSSAAYVRWKVRT